MTTVIIEIPQRSQIVNRASPVKAGYRLPALTLLTAMGSGIAGFLIQKANIAPFYIFLVSSCLTTVGLVLLSTISVHEHTHPATYGYQIILSLGIAAFLEAHFS